MLYRKYRPLSFDEVVGQEHVVRTLQGALITGRVGHAYLFTGPRGTGKTTIARVFAKSLNCLHRTKEGNPDNSCDRCVAVNDGRSLDLIEIDGASNGRVDEMRSLKESATVAASGGGYKTFLIDEVHMVSTGGFNALLKILEEPPSHVIFILATTDPHKIPPTVLSRVQRFDFRKLSPEQILEKLSTIVKAEKAQVTQDALLTIAKSSDGALRDAEVALTKILSSFPKGEKISDQQVLDTLGLIPISYHPEFLNLLVKKDKAAAVAFVGKLYDSGVNLEHFIKDFLSYLRELLLAKIDDKLNNSSALQQIETPQLIQMLTAFTTARQQLKTSPIPQLPLELAIIDLTL